MLLIGSRALQLRQPSCLTRSPLDFDFVATQAECDQWIAKNKHKVPNAEVYQMPEFGKWICKSKDGTSNPTYVEFEIVKAGHSSELLVDLVENDPETIDTPFGKVPSLDLLFTTKDSHRFKKFNDSCNGWWKTIIDWSLMRNAGAKIRPEYQEYHKLRSEEAYKGQKHPKLNVSKDDFFKDDLLKLVYDHDDIHEAVKLFDKPAYEYYLQDNSPVLCSKKKFFEVSEEIRLAGALEEGLTLSLERSYIPNQGVWQPDQIFRFAIGKVGSSITSGFFREYVCNHIFEVMRLYNETSRNYCEKFDQALAAGKVRPFSGSKY